MINFFVFLFEGILLIYGIGVVAVMITAFLQPDHKFPKRTYSKLFASFVAGLLWFLIFINPDG